MEDSTKLQKTARESMWENDGLGEWVSNYRKHYDLTDPKWRFDAISELLHGKNIASIDYVDIHIDEKKEVLEWEEE